jgi:phosphinothricin acetyltransferase
VIVRVATPEDAEACRAIYAPVVVDTAISFETEPPDAAEMAARIARTLQTHPWLVAEADGEVLGYAYASPHRDRAAYRWSVDVTAYVAEAARSRGVGRALYKRLIRVLRLQGFAAAFGGITLPNPASVALHEAVGFKPVGVYPHVGYKHGRWRDTGWWGLVLDPSEAEPQEPTPFAALIGSPALKEALS